MFERLVPAPMSELQSRILAALEPSYRVDRELDGGGMARVFLATDTALSRRVVVKLLPPDAALAVSAERFQREISLAARLQHPHIVPLLSAGEAAGVPYFTMPFVEGESLRSRLARQGELPVTAAVRLLREIAAALAYAHSQGIVHRDIKPDNVLMSGDSAMVTDFGVAKALAVAERRERPEGGTPPAPSAVEGKNLQDFGGTSRGIALGTPAYMAPEQASADPTIDHRADIYACGVLAYELLTGQPPFTGRSPTALLAAHVTELPEPVSQRRPAIPPALAALVMRCLEKRPADRPQSASEIVHALDELLTPSGGTAPTTATPSSRHAAPGSAAPTTRRLTWIGIVAGALGLVTLGVWRFVAQPGGREGAPTAAPVERKIAVLPFESLGGDTANAYLADGMATDLTAALAAAGRLTVVPRSSAFALRGHTAKDAGDKLQAANVVEGTVKRAGGRLRVTVSLVNIADETVRWSRKYDEDERAVFQLHDSIANAIAAVLDVGASMATDPGKAAPPTKSIEAHDFVQRAVFINNQSADAKLLRQAIRLAEDAIARDSAYVDAWIAMADSWFNLADNYVAPDEAVPHIRRAASRAAALDPRSADAHAMLGVVRGAYEREYRDAESEFHRALAIDPTNAMASSGYAWHLWSMGMPDSALAVLSRGLRQNPLSSLLLNPAVAISLGEGRMELARTYCRRYMELGSAGAECDAQLLDAEGRFAEAAALIRQRSAGQDRTTARRRARLARALALSGDSAGARKEIAAIEAEARTHYVDGFWPAIAYTALGDRRRALAWLERAFIAHSSNIPTMKRNLELAPLRGDAGFESIARRAGL